MAIRSSPQDSLARLRTLRALLTGEDRARFERLVAEIGESLDELRRTALELAGRAAASLPPANSAQAVDVGAALARAAALARRTLAARNIRADVHADPLPPVLADPGRLDDLLLLLVEAAARSAASAGTVRVRATLGSDVVVEVSPLSKTDPGLTLAAALAASMGHRLTMGAGGVRLWLRACSPAASA